MAGGNLSIHKGIDALHLSRRLKTLPPPVGPRHRALETQVLKSITVNELHEVPSSPVKFEGCTSLLLRFAPNHIEVPDEAKGELDLQSC